MISCSKPTQEELIEKAFKEYVNKNFDDPSCLKEIISIKVEDTLSATKTISFIENILGNSDSTTDKVKSINDSLKNTFDANLKKIQASKRLTSKYYGDKVGLDILEELINHAKIEMQYLASTDYQTYKFKRSALENATNTLKKDSTFIVTFEIKTRIFTKDKELEIKKYYAQTQNDNTINIFEDNSLESYPSIYTDTYKDLESYTELYKRNIDFLFEKTSILERAIRFYRID